MLVAVCSGGGGMARRALLIAVVSLLLSVSVASPSAWGEGYSDVGEDSVHEPAIDALVSEGVFDGTECGEGLFCPGDPIPRWVVAVWLVRVLDDGDPLGPGAGSFADVDGELWWAAFVERLAVLGVTAGCRVDPLRFCPDESVTRAQMATFLVRAFGLQEGSPAGFQDVADTAHQANIDAPAGAGITAGCRVEPLQFCPGDPVTRGQMATFIARAEEARSGGRRGPRTVPASHSRSFPVGIGPLAST